MQIHGLIFGNGKKMLTRRQLWRKVKSRREGEEHAIIETHDDSFSTEDGIAFCFLWRTLFNVFNFILFIDILIGRSIIIITSDVSSPGSSPRKKCNNQKSLSFFEIMNDDMIKKLPPMIRVDSLDLLTNCSFRIS